MEETDAFFLLASVCETLMPQYYNRGMLGSLVDVHLFGDLISLFLPDIARHFKKLAVPVPAITMPWFLCLYIGYVPIEIALRILDAFFCEGIDVLFRVGLAIFKVNQQYILKAEDSYSILVMLKRGVKLSDEILKIALEDFGAVSINIVRDNREIHKAEAVKVVDANARKDKINSLSSTTKFTKDELHNLYHWAQATTDSFMLSKSQLPGVIIQFCPFWKDIVSSEIGVDDPVGDLQRQLWKFFNKNGAGDSVLTFDELVFGLSQILKGTLKERWEVCTYLSGCTENDLNSKQLIKGLDLLLRMYNKPKPETEIVNFVNMIFDKAEKMGNSINCNYVQQEVIDKPLLLEYFGLNC